MKSKRFTIQAGAFLLALAIGVLSEAQENPRSLPATLTLEECLSIAHSQNRTVLSARARIDATRARASQVRATQKPTAQIQLSETSFKEPTGPTALDRQDAQRLTVIESVQPFGKNLAQRRAARAQVTAAQAEEDRAAIEIGFQVTRTFFDILLAEELTKVASDSLDQLGRQCDRARKLFEAGSAPRFDLLRAQVQFAAAKPALIKAIRSRDSAMADLMQLLHGDIAAIPALIGSFPTSPPELPRTEEEALTLAIRRRPDLASAIASEEAARRQVEAAKEALQPSLALTGTLERTRGSRVPAAEYSDNWSVGMSLQYPFFDSGLSKAQAKEASANREQALRLLESTLATLRADIRKARLLLGEAEEVIASQVKNVEQAQEALTIAQTAYETGAKTSLDVLDAQLALTQARTVYSQALHDRAIAVAQYQKALGLLEPFIPNDFVVKRSVQSKP